MDNEDHTKRLSWRILNAYYGRIYSLLDYLAQTSDTPTSPDVSHLLLAENEQGLRSFLLRDSDPQAYRDLMLTSIVAESVVKHGKVSTRLKITTPISSMTEIIDRAQARLFSKSRKPSNIITTGYRSAEFRSETGKGGAGGARQGVINFFVNTLVTALQGSEWSLLLKRVGDAILLHLLTETSLYIALPNDCYCQLLGPPLLYTIPPHFIRDANTKEGRSESEKPVIHHSLKRSSPDGEDSSTRTSKRRKRNNVPIKPSKLENGMSNLPSKYCTAAAIPIARAIMFYARVCKRTEAGSIRLGLPADHILNRMETKAWRRSKGLVAENGDLKGELRPGDRNGILEARHLSKYVFPLQYNLDNVFSSQASHLRNDQFTRFKFVDREDEIELKGSCKTPPRLKNLLPLLAQLYHCHTKCGYKALLDKICPSKLRPDHRDATADSSTILELISENVVDELQTQRSFTMSNTTLISSSGQQTRDSSRRGNTEPVSRSQSQMKLKPRFAEFICSAAEVHLYVCTVTKEVIPSALWGSEKNRRTVFHHVKQLIGGRRNEGMTLHNVLQGISTAECDWLMAYENPTHRAFQSEAEMLKRRELLQEFIFWYFDQFLLFLLRTTFYITDSSAYRNRLLYFRQDDWDVLCQPLLDRLAETTFEAIPQHEAEACLQQRKLGYSFVRLLPKDSGVRPIVNLRRKRIVTSENPSDHGQSINQVLSAAFEILGYEKRMQVEKLGASVFGPNETYRRLKQFKAGLVDASGKLPKLYFVKVDVQACFDTIEQSKLLSILKNLITEDVYMIQKYGQIIRSTGRVRRRFMRNAIPDYEHPHFLVYAKQLASLLRNAILVDQVVYPFAFRDEIVQLLEDHITSNIVKIGHEYYRQRVGIPQGSVLSTLLCSFFYGDLERTELLFTTDPSKQNVLLRLIDDYLFVTTDVRDARHFLEVMNQGHPEYGCFISRQKTLTNFEHYVGDISQLSLSTVMHPDRKLFPWCGYLINTENLSVTADYSRFHDTYLIDSLTTERSRRPYVIFLQKMLQQSKAKALPIFTDTGYNSSRVVRVNVYQSFVLTAMKMHAYILVARHNAGGLAFMPRTAHSFKSGTGAVGSDKPNRKKRDIKGLRNKRGEGAFLLKVVRQCIRYTHASIRSKFLRHTQESGARCDLSKDEVIWLGTHAFHSVLAIKRTSYSQAGLLGALGTELTHPRFQPVKRRLERIARESLDDMLKNIEF